MRRHAFRSTLALGLLAAAAALAAFPEDADTPTEGWIYGFRSVIDTAQYPIATDKEGAFVTDKWVAYAVTHLLAVADAPTRHGAMSIGKEVNGHVSHRRGGVVPDGAAVWVPTNVAAAASVAAVATATRGDEKKCAGRRDSEDAGFETHAPDIAPAIGQQYCFEQSPKGVSLHRDSSVGTSKRDPA